MRITRMVAGKEVEVPIKDAWPSIVKVIRLARITAQAGSVDSEKQFKDYRLALLYERLDDFDGYTFHVDPK